MVPSNRNKQFNSAKTLFRHIGKNVQRDRRYIVTYATGKGRQLKYTELGRSSTTDISFTDKQDTEVQLSIKINGRWKAWVHTKHSTIPNAGYGLFPSHKFMPGDNVGIFLGRKLRNHAISNHQYSNYAMEDCDPCDRKGKMMHWYFMNQFINHGNYTVANIRFDPSLHSFCTKILEKDNEFLMDYQRPIFCKSCHEYRKTVGLTKRKRVKTRKTRKGVTGKCSHCLSGTDKLILRECRKCQKKLCIDCYDKLQKSF
jgi:hypothetical protein